MVRSMTGFGRCEASDEKRRITVELKAVNHRYLDLNIKLPRKLNFFEAAVRNLLKTYIQRGKVDVYITYESFAEGQNSLRYNKELAAEYLKYLGEMAKDFSLENDIRVSTLSRYPDVLTMEDQEIDEDELWRDIEPVIKGACENFVHTREVEGENLAKDLTEKLDNILKNVEFIKERSPIIIEEYKAGLKAKIADLLGDTAVDEGRLLTEVTIFADKVCVDEEMVRLISHVNQTKKALSGSDGVGRKLDFIAQEMNREANTILSKSSDILVADVAIELKTEIEKVREQIQNIE